MNRIQITTEQKDFFNENGFLLLEKVLEDSDLQDVIDELNLEIDVRARKLFERGELSEASRKFCGKTCYKPVWCYLEGNESGRFNIVKQETENR